MPREVIAATIESVDSKTIVKRKKFVKPNKSGEVKIKSKLNDSTHGCEKAFEPTCGALAMSCPSVIPLFPQEAGMGCCGINGASREEAEERKIQIKKNKEIERQIQKDKQVYRATHRLLLLGAGESGKSTLVKQMRILHEETPFNEEEKKEKKDEIRRNVKDSITTILQAMTTIDPPVSCADPDLEDRYNIIQYDCTDLNIQFSINNTASFVLINQRNGFTF